MTSCLTEPGSPTFRFAIMGNRAGTEDGFTLLEVVCVVAIIAIIAAIALPSVPHATSRPRLEAVAVETASMFKADRNAAVRRRIQVATEIDAAERSIRSGSTGRTIRIPADIAVDAILPERCNNSPALSKISFFASGMSCGGAVALTRLGAGYEVRVNWLTGGVEIVTRSDH